MSILRQERERRGWSRAELSRRAVMNAATVGQIEAGRIVPYASQLAKLAQALGFDRDPAELLHEASHELTAA